MAFKASADDSIAVGSAAVLIVSGQILEAVSGREIGEFSTSAATIPQQLKDTWEGQRVAPPKRIANEDIKLIAVDIDGPLLTDSFAPLLKLSCEFYGLDYTKDMEDNMFSRNRAEATAYFRSQFKEVPEDLKGKTSEEMEQSYFEFRQNYLKENPITLAEGAEALMDLLPCLGVKLVCYGGLDEKYMRRDSARRRLSLSNIFAPTISARRR